MSRLLLDDEPILVLPSLAKVVGLNESIFLQQLHYWLQKSNHNYEGHRWVYNTYEGWQEQFPFWSVSTIRRTITKLENEKYLITGNFNKLKIDKKKWYRIDYHRLEGVNRPSVQNEQTICSERTDEAPNMNRPLAEITTEITNRKIDDEKHVYTKSESDGAPKTDQTDGDVLLRNGKTEVSHTDQYALTLENIFIQRRGRGLTPSARDLTAIYEVVKSGIEMDDAIKFTNECFDAYKPKYPGDVINAFAYVKQHIFHHAYLQKERKLAERTVMAQPIPQPQIKPAKRYGGSNRKEIVPEWLEQQKQDESSIKDQEQLDFETEKAKLEAELKQYKKRSEDY